MRQRSRSPARSRRPGRESRSAAPLSLRPTGSAARPGPPARRMSPRSTTGPSRLPVRTRDRKRGRVGRPSARGRSARPLGWLGTRQGRPATCPESPPDRRPSPRGKRTPAREVGHPPRQEQRRTGLGQVRGVDRRVAEVVASVIEHHQHHHGPAKDVDGVDASNGRRRRHEGNSVVRRRGRIDRNGRSPFRRPGRISKRTVPWMANDRQTATPGGVLTIAELMLAWRDRSRPQ